ncbi:hypothetical protein BESB_000580 [Besnoitia besnoiti]|uniref:Uncharacterized protein n=1 Tax=Besnoitia besnoiti TaxID=94643 RepID=A0A2A9MND2_BESBE|nr:hypothetical protein BESB_000580 [Besnoitia besnoiti]PFH37716.1 hypothetical protein BESB_000580 [Besnoitia besnoiti]
MGSRSDVSPRVPPATALKFAVAASAAEQRSLRMRSQSSLALRHQEARATRATGKLERESFRLGVAERPGAPGRPLAERALSNVAPGSAQDVETTASSSLSSYRPRRSLRKGDARRHCRDRGESFSSSTDSDNATARGGGGGGP